MPGAHVLHNSHVTMKASLSVAMSKRHPIGSLPKMANRNSTLDAGKIIDCFVCLA